MTAMTDEEIVELADSHMQWGKVCYVDADRRRIIAFARALLESKVAVQDDSEQAFYEATKPRPETSGVGEYCQPGDRREPRWIVMYDDIDRGLSIFEDEQDARDCFAGSESMGWNCWLFSPTPRVASPAPPAQSQPVACEVCNGSKGGVPGNENIIDGKRVCDYCHADGSYKPPQTAEPWEMEWPQYSHQGMGCGLEDRGITDRYDAMRYGWDEAIEQVACVLVNQTLFAAPPAQTAVTDSAAMPEEVVHQQESLMHPATQIFFRAGLLACREYMARFVEHESPTIAASIRANWWPSLGQDFGPPRLNTWEELTVGEYGEEGFRGKSADEVSPTQEALPIALQFLQSLDPGKSAASEEKRGRVTIDMGMPEMFRHPHQPPEDQS